jgi:hypothetical protein
MLHLIVNLVQTQSAIPKKDCTLTLRGRSRVKTSGAPMKGVRVLKMAIPSKHVGSHFGTGETRTCALVTKCEEPQKGLSHFAGPTPTRNVEARRDKSQRPLQKKNAPHEGGRLFLRGRRDFPMAYRPSGRPPASLINFSMNFRLFILLMCASNRRASAFLSNVLTYTSFHGLFRFVERVQPSLCRWHLRTGS